MKYIDAEKLKAEIARLRKEHTTREYRDEAALVLEDLEDYIDSLQQEQPETDIEKEIDACWQNWLSPSSQKEVEGVLPKTEFAMYARHFAKWGADHLADVRKMVEPQKEPNYTKCNELFDKCVANCDPKVMQEVSDNIDKLKSISTPAEEDWFKISEEWEKEDKKSETERNDLDEAAQAYANGPDVAWVGTSALECAFKAGAEWAMNHKENKE